MHKSNSPTQTITASISYELFRVRLLCLCVGVVLCGITKCGTLRGSHAVFLVVCSRFVVCIVCATHLSYYSCSYYFYSITIYSVFVIFTKTAGKCNINFFWLTIYCGVNQTLILFFKLEQLSVTYCTQITDLSTCNELFIGCMTSFSAA